MRQRFLENLAANWLAYVSILAAGAMVTILRQFIAAWGVSLLYGLAASACAAVAYYFGIVLPRATGKPPESAARGSPRVTASDIESEIRSWLDAFGLNVRKLPSSESPDTIFALTITPNSRVPITVARTKEMDRYILMQSKVVIAEEHKATLAGLTDTEQSVLFEEVSLELARSGIGFRITYPLKEVVLVKRMPITQNLTEDAFIETLGQVESVAILFRHSFRLGLHKLAPGAVFPLSLSSSQPALDTEPPTPAGPPAPRNGQ